MVSQSEIAEKLLSEIIKKCETDKEMWDKVCRYLSVLHILESRGYVTYKSINGYRYVNPNRVIACAWNPRRLQFFCNMSESELEQFIKKNPIRVIGYIDRTNKFFYEIEDGNHRTVCARKKGLKKIKAEVSGIYGKLTKKIYYFNDMLWYLEDGRYVGLIKSRPEDIDLLADLYYILGSDLIVIKQGKKLRKYREGMFIDHKYIITVGGARYFVLSDSIDYATVRGEKGGIFTVSHSDIAWVEE